jgi:hypothetical protein
MDPWFTSTLVRGNKMKRLDKFTELEKEHIHELKRDFDREGIQWKFPNGYGASVASNEMTSHGPELAVLKFNELDEVELVYDTPITSDVIPGVNIGDTRAILSRIKGFQNS